MLMTPVQPFRISTDHAEPVDFDAYLAACEAADCPALHPDQFRFMLSVMLPQHPVPVWCVATIGVDDRGQVAVDDAWIFLPGRQAVKKHRGDDFNRIRLEAISQHYEALIARAAEIRVPFRQRAAA